MNSTDVEPKRKRRSGLPEPSSEAARHRMVSVGQRDTAPELKIRSILHKMGLRYRVDHSPLEGMRRRADLVFCRLRIAVFIDGCFWHGCPIHGTYAKANAEFWCDKIEGNQRRDRDTDRKLIEAGWTVVRIWEHEDPKQAAEKIAHIVRTVKPIV